MQGIFERIMTILDAYSRRHELRFSLKVWGSHDGEVYYAGVYDSDDGEVYGTRGKTRALALEDLYDKLENTMDGAGWGTKPKDDDE